MKNLLYIIGCMVVIIACKETNKQKDKNSNTNGLKERVIDSNICKHELDSTLIKYAEDFSPSAIELNLSMSNDLKEYVSKIDTNCLRKQKEYKVFITTIMAKLYYYHLMCCKQGYDLFQMETGPAQLIINELVRIGKYDRTKLEMLNSGIVVDIVSKDTTLAQLPKLKELLKNISIESKRILSTKR